MVQDVPPSNGRPKSSILSASRFDPQKSSTPLKMNGQLNGGSLLKSQNESPSSPKKRGIVWMDESDEEGSSSKARVNGFANGVNGRNKRRRRNSAFGAGNGSSGAQEELQEQRRQLPIAKGREALIREIREHDVTVLLGETGSGKTTQVPQYLLESGVCGSGMIGITQPRRVAATSLATRVAHEQNTPLGQKVGYSVRFEESSSAETKIKYLTDGMLVREMLGDPLLERYSVVVVDEAHERTLRTDLVVAKLKALLKVRNGVVKEERGGMADRKGKGKAREEVGSGTRNPLKVVIMSATLDAEKFSNFFDGAKVLYVKGRQHPVKIYHTATGVGDYVEAALRTFFQIHVDQPPGDVLIFLPGQEDIESLEKSIQLFANRLPKEGMGVQICLMFASLPAGQQSKVFNPTPPDTRKCILATNIAETSITIPGVKYVIDSGKHKEKRYVAREMGSGFDALLTRDINKSSAMQRAGRAGREGKGFCFRLYTEDAFNSLPPSSDPEIRRCSLDSAYLQLKCLGEDLEDLDLMDKPDIEAIRAAFTTLWLLDALDDRKNLTALGRNMAFLPLEPNLACAVMASKELGCTKEVIDIVSVLSSSSKLFYDLTDDREVASEARRKFSHPSGDHLTILNAFVSYQELSGESKGARRDWCRKHFLNERTLIEATKIRDQLRASCDRLGIDWRATSKDNEQAVLKCLFRGLVQNAALIQPDGMVYRQAIGRASFRIHPGSVLRDKKAAAIIYDDLVYTTQIYARGVSAVPKSFLAQCKALKPRGK